MPQPVWQNVARGHVGRSHRRRLSLGAEAGQHFHHDRVRLTCRSAGDEHAPYYYYCYSYYYYHSLCYSIYYYYYYYDWYYWNSRSFICRPVLPLTAAVVVSVGVVMAVVAVQVVERWDIIVPVAC